jgi:hypothetical protein
VKIAAQLKVAPDQYTLDGKLFDSSCRHAAKWPVHKASPYRTSVASFTPRVASFTASQA